MRSGEKSFEYLFQRIAGAGGRRGGKRTEMMMTDSTQQSMNQFTEIWKNNLAICEKMFDAAINSAKRVEDERFLAAREAMVQNLHYAKALLEAKDVQGLMSLNTAFAQPGMEKMLEHYRKLYQAVAEAQQEMMRLSSTTMQDLNAKTAQGMARPAGVAGGSDVAMAAVNSFINACNAAYGNAMNVTKNLVEGAVAPDAKAASRKSTAKA
jgi:phasin family protein